MKGDGLKMIPDTFRMYKLELWELFGGSAQEHSICGEEYMEDFKEQNLADLYRMGEISVAVWRKLEGGKAWAEAGK